MRQSSPVKKTRILRNLLLILIVFSILIVITLNLIVIGTTKKQIRTPEQLLRTEADCILVLGAGVRDDGTPSNMLEDRLIVGIQLYEQGTAPVLLMSGDHGREGYNEVGCMKEYALKNGVPENDIFMDHAGFSTYDSLYRARQVFGAKKVLIITQGYHLYRALYLANALGLEAYGVSADLRTYVGQSMRDTRELAARVKDFFYALFQPLPKFLGDSISLADSGTVTNG